MENREYGTESDLLDELYEARARWRRAEWITTPRVMARVGIDEALDNYNEYMRAVEDFEEVFNGQG